MSYQWVFSRYEMKYLLSKKQAGIIKDAMSDYMQADRYGKSTICNLYFDTPNHLLVRRSSEKPLYKEKLRLRSYGIPRPGGKVFVEIKKKCKGITYKRRMDASYQESLAFLAGKQEALPDTQIKREIAYFLKLYPGIAPAMCISYDREAYFGKEDSNFRITFDSNILWRDDDLSLSKGIYGQRVIEGDMVLLEVKTAMGLPLWLTKALSENGIYKTSFSKYGTAYQIALQTKKNGGIGVA